MQSQAIRSKNNINRISQHNAPDSPESKLVGGSIQDPDKTRWANPITYVDQNAAPFLIVHRTLDRLVPFNQRQLLAAALKSAGALVTFHPAEGDGHGGILAANGGCGFYVDPEVGRCEGILRRPFSGKTRSTRVKRGSKYYSKCCNN
jgi:acetyl esterase/lipase